jgi:hypothetical protein
MLPVLTMHVAVDDVIDVPGMRDRDVFAADAVDVIRGVRRAIVWIAALQIVLAELVLVDVIAVRVVQVPVVHVIDVIVVPHREMPARVAVNVLVPVVNVRFHMLSSTYDSSTGGRPRQRDFGEQAAQTP